MVHFFLRCPEVGLGICLFAIERKMKSRIPKPTSGHHLDRSFFFWCPEVGLGICLFAIARMTKPRIPKPTSGHRMCSESFRCSFGCWVWVSRGRIRILILLHPDSTSGHRMCSESFRCSLGCWVFVLWPRLRRRSRFGSSSLYSSSASASSSSSSRGLEVLGPSEGLKSLALLSA